MSAQGPDRRGPGDAPPRGGPGRPRAGPVLRALLDAVADGPVHLTLLDPGTTDPDTSARKATAARAGGTWGLMVGGSTEVTPDALDATVAAVKEATGLPTILFPNAAATGISPHADAIFFMSLLNSTDPRFLVREQVRGAPLVKELGIEPIPMGYLVVAPGMRVGEVGRAEPLPRDDPDAAVAYALAAQYLGMALVYLEAGSGAPDPVPAELVAAVREAVDVPVVVGGGIRAPDDARALAKAGADVLVTGTLVEEVADVEGRVRALVDALAPP